MKNPEGLSTKYPELDSFFGSYFHQDFNLDYGSPEGTIAAYAKFRKRERVLKVISEIEAIQRDTSIKDLTRAIFFSFGCCYDFEVDHPTPEAFLKKIKKQLQEELGVGTKNPTSRAACLVVVKRKQKRKRKTVAKS